MCIYTESHKKLAAYQSVAQRCQLSHETNSGHIEHLH